MVGWFKLNSFIYLLYVEQSVWTGPYADISLDADDDVIIGLRLHCLQLEYFMIIHSLVNSERNNNCK